MCKKSYVDSVDNQAPKLIRWFCRFGAAHSPESGGLENNVDSVDNQAPKLIFDNMCEKSYVDNVDNQAPKLIFDNMS